MRHAKYWLSLTLTVAGVSGWARAAGEPAVEFNRDIRPILSDNCFACHGPDANQRKADLRLDQEKSALAEHDGYAILKPGKPEESELFLRVTSQDATKRMPPRKFGKQLSAQQVALLRRWIEQGAKWQGHWSFLPPTRPPLPQGAPGAPGAPGADAPGSPARNPIDQFILARLAQVNLPPAPEADKRTLIRRLSFDLTGLPPTPEEVDAFVQDSSPDAYEKVVDRLLRSPHYGERMALYWLDVVRYADTGGYHSDNHRDVWLFRDWVIQAFNNNMPFDQFTIEQLAGDLLPNPTRDQKIASGYNRLLQTTEEGGAQPKEYAAKYAADRVRNTATIWLGLTMGCTECHDHKYDPLTTKEFYQFAAFFADVQEKAVGRQDQTPLPTAEQEKQLRQLDEQMAPLRKVLDIQTPELDAAQAKWETGLKLAEVRKLPKPVVEALLLDPAKRNPQQKQAVAAHYRTVAPLLEPTRKQLAELQKQKDALNKTIPTSLITIAVPPRTMRVLPRGNWLSDAGEVVEPGVPGSLNPLGVAGRRATRLDLAKWVVAPDNPMTARVFVNRLWKLMFGQGLVKTLDDFGAQGAWPSHPDLLDWLAVEFMSEPGASRGEPGASRGEPGARRGEPGASAPGASWDVKRMVKLMVMSRTYRQSSAAAKEVQQRDPYNQYLARQNRFRLDAELIRDNALAVSGLLNRKLGGPSVKPYQPAGYWAYLNFPKREWYHDKGPDQYRRGLYTYWCRTFLQPSLLAFDASTREECTVERPRSNTPLQALVLLNDPTYVEAARTLAERILRDGGADTPGRIQFAYRQVLSRAARPEEVAILAGLFDKHVKQYQADREAASALLHVGERPAPRDLDAAELAAWTSVTRALLNLHESITRD